MQILFFKDGYCRPTFNTVMFNGHVECFTSLTLTKTFHDHVKEKKVNGSGFL